MFMPGFVVSGKQAVWQIFRVRVNDSANNLFEQQKTVVTIQKAVGNASGEIELLSDDLEAGASQATVYSQAVSTDHIERVTVPVVALDDMISERVDMIKMDDRLLPPAPSSTANTSAR